MDLILKGNEKVVIAVGVDLSLNRAGVSVSISAGSSIPKGGRDTTWRNHYDVSNVDMECDSMSTDIKRRIESYEAASAGLIKHIFDLIYDAVFNFRTKETIDIIIAIEGYSYASIGATHKTGELGSIFRREIMYGLACLKIASRWEAVIIEVPPTVLKKFATGKGNAKKAAVVSMLSRKYDIEFSTDDQADAFCLSLIGLCVKGMATTTLHEAKIVSEIQRHIFKEVSKFTESTED